MGRVVEFGADLAANDAKAAGEPRLTACEIRAGDDEPPMMIAVRAPLDFEFHARSSVPHTRLTAWSARPYGPDCARVVPRAEGR
jgi:hypothetical protein